MRPIAALSEMEIEALRRVGFWRSDGEPNLPDPRDFVDLAWRESEGDRVLEYLDSAYDLPYVCAGFSFCRLGCPDIPCDIGTQDRTDGRYLFPEGLAHYVRVHSIRPPEEFLEHIRANDFRVPNLPVLSSSGAA